MNKRIRDHYIAVWGTEPVQETWQKGPIADLPQGFCVLRFQPTPARNAWTYATCGLSLKGDRQLEIFLLSPSAAAGHVELLSAIAHYHCTEAELGLGHIVNFGRPWLPDSECSHGLLSLPYLDGPKLEWLSFPDRRKTRVLWLIPITRHEKDFAKEHGLESLERRFDSTHFDYLDPFRKSTV